jgi:hypothetical protein
MNKNAMLRLLALEQKISLILFRIIVIQKISPILLSIVVMQDVVFL